MNNIELNTKDLNVIKSIMSKYEIIHNDIATIEKKMEELQNKAFEQISTLQKTRKEEGEFLTLLINTYGEGKYDPTTMKWIPAEKGEKV